MKHRIDLAIFEKSTLFILAISLVLTSRINGQNRDQSISNRAPAPVIDSTIMALNIPKESVKSFVILQTGDTIVGKAFYSLDWQSKRITLLSSLTPLESKSAKSIVVSKQGVLAFTTVDSARKERLFIRNSDSTVVIDPPFHDRYVAEVIFTGQVEVKFGESAHFPAFALSPNGNYIIAYANRDLALIDTGAGTVITQFTAARLNIGEQMFQYFISDTAKFDGLYSDNGFYRKFVDWATDDANCLIISDFYPGQLENRQVGIWKYNSVDGSRNEIGPNVEQYLSISADGRYILYTNNDESCCGGTNYNDRLLILYEINTRTKQFLFDEWASYNNEGKAEEHIPINAELSPNNQLVATTISGYIDRGAKSNEPDDQGPDTVGNFKADRLVLVLKTDGTVCSKIRDRELLGWLDGSHLLIRPYFEQWNEPNKWISTEGDLEVFDLGSGRELPLLSNSAKYLSVQRSFHE